VNLSAWLQELAGLDTGDGRGRAHLGTRRHRLLTVPARLIRHGECLPDLAEFGLGVGLAGLPAPARRPAPTVGAGG
jgi:hypothetical protein